MSSELVEVIVRGGGLGENRRIASSDQTATLAFERFEHK